MSTVKRMRPNIPPKMDPTITPTGGPFEVCDVLEDAMGLGTSFWDASVLVGGTRREGVEERIEVVLDVELTDCVEEGIREVVVLLAWVTTK
jgi:hypothetical protein